MTLHRYFLKRWGLSLLGSIMFFGGLLLANDLVRISRDIFSQGGSIRWLLPILLTTIPETLTLVLPMAAILGGLMGTQSLAEGSEFVASQGLGAGMRSILKPWTALSIFLILIGLANANLVVPRVGEQFKQIEASMIEETKTRFLRPGAPPFISSKQPQTGIWVAPDKEIHLFEVTPTEVQHLVARGMTWSQTSDRSGNTQLVLQLLNLRGSRYDRANDAVGLISQESQDLSFDVPSQSRLVERTSERYLPTRELLGSIGNGAMLKSLLSVDKEKDEDHLDLWIEFSRRIGIPFSIVSLLLLGISLGLDHPRFQRGGAIVKSLGVILAYYFIMRYFENAYELGTHPPWILFTTPLIFFAFSISLLIWKMRPHKTRHLWFTGFLKRVNFRSAQKLGSFLSNPLPMAGPSSALGKTILGRWTRRAWLKNWLIVLGTLLVLDFMLELAPIASNLAKNNISIFKYFHYWILNLPVFLVIAFPITFLLAGVMSLSEATMHREWMALKAGGVSLLQWIRSGAKVWMAVAVLALFIQAIVAPMVAGRATDTYREIKNQPPRTYQNKPWMHLTSTDVLWYLEKNQRWGFPLAAPETAPVLYRWKRGAERIGELSLGGLYFVTGPEAASYFPSEALRKSATAEETNTLDLFLWQKWAPDPETASMLWGRLLNWLAGPCLMFATLAFAFPSPRGGRGQVLGYCLIVGLLFLGLQALFGGAARAGEIPALWGILAPLLVLVGAGFFNLRRLKT